MIKKSIPWLILMTVSILVYTSVIEIELKNTRWLNFIIGFSTLITAIFAIGDQIADKTGFEFVAKINFRMLMIVFGFDILIWASIKKDDVSAEDARGQVKEMQSYYLANIDTLVKHSTDSIMNAKIGVLYTDLSKLIGGAAADTVIEKSFAYRGPVLTFIRPEIAKLAGSTTLAPIFEYHLSNVGGPAYNINIAQAELALSNRAVKTSDYSIPKYRIPRGHVIGENQSFNYSDTIFSTGSRDIYYFLFIGTYEDALHNRYDFKEVLEYDMKTDESGVLTSPKQEQILGLFEIVGQRIH